jgi:hypothetical protein
MRRIERLAYAGLAALVVSASVLAFLSPRWDSLFLSPVNEEIVLPGHKYKRQIYFNKPEELYYDEQAEIVLLLESKPLDAGRISLAFQNLEGKVEQRSVRVGAYLSAKLSAPASLLDIAPSDDKLRKIDPQGETRFAWYVRPVAVGVIPIRLDLLSQDDDSADSAVRPVQVFQDNWTATARGLNIAKYYLTEYKWGLTAIGGLLGFFGVNTWLKRRNDDADDEE